MRPVAFLALLAMVVPLFVAPPVEVRPCPTLQVVEVAQCDALNVNRWCNQPLDQVYECLFAFRVTG